MESFHLARLDDSIFFISRSSKSLKFPSFFLSLRGYVGLRICLSGFTGLIPLMCIFLLSRRFSKPLYTALCFFPLFFHSLECVCHMCDHRASNYHSCGNYPANSFRVHSHCAKRHNYNSDFKCSFFHVLLLFRDVPKLNCDLQSKIISQTEKVLDIHSFRLSDPVLDCFLRDTILRCKVCRIFTLLRLSARHHSTNICHFLLCGALRKIRFWHFLTLLSVAFSPFVVCSIKSKGEKFYEYIYFCSCPNWFTRNCLFSHHDFLLAPHKH
nr:MAG TPA: hypothetical protein [Caudoviricetes sp.]